MVKGRLKLSTDLFTKLIEMPPEKKKILVDYLEERSFDYNTILRRHQIGMFKNLEQYYAVRDEQDQVVVNGILVLRYQKKINNYDRFEWAEHAIHLAPYCCEIRAFRQAHYMLRAAEVMLASIKDILKERPNLYRSDKARVLEGRLKLGLAQHCLVVLYETKNLSVINESVRRKEQLTRQQIQDLKIDQKISVFQGLHVPDGDTRLDGILQSSTDVREVYEKTKKLMKDVRNHLTEDERNAVGYDIVAEKMNEMLSYFSFLAVQ